METQKSQIRRYQVSQQYSPHMDKETPISMELMPAHSREEQEDEHFDVLSETFVRLKSADLIGKKGIEK